jgi:ribonuclease HII
MAKTKITIGIDEAGTGSWCGPASCCAFAIYDVDEPWLLASGARDSKATGSHAARLKLMEALAPCAIVAKTELISAAAMSKDHRGAWREGIAKAAAHVLTAIGTEVRIIIDGNPDRGLSDYFLRVWDVEPIYRPKADLTVPAVSAASIFAKVARTEYMLELATCYPAYKFEEHDGYGTPEHQRIIEILGVTEEHRRIRPLLKFFNPEVPHEAPDLPSPSPVDDEYPG